MVTLGGEAPLVRELLTLKEAYSPDRLLQAGKSINGQQYCVGLIAKPPILATQSDLHDLSNQRNVRS